MSSHFETSSFTPYFTVLDERSMTALALASAR
jgi:hypothetical protein